MLQLITLGELSISGLETPAGALGIRKPLALLAVVAASGELGVSRDRLQALFWPESDSERARGGLKQAQYLIRQTLGADPFMARGPNVALDPDVIGADITEFQSHCRTGALDLAVSLYKGPFLDGVYLKDALEFDQWMEAERAQLASLYARALERLAGDASERRDYSAAADWWRRRANVDRLDGRVARCYMVALAAVGDRDAALRHARAHAELVRSELAEEPDADVLAFAEQLRAAPAQAPEMASSGGRFEPAARTLDVRTPEVPIAIEQERGTLPDAELATAASSKQRHRRLAMVPLVAVLVAVAWLGLKQALVFAGSRAADDVPKMRSDRVVVAAFENRTGDPSFDMAGFIVSDWVTRGLQQSGLVDVVDPTAALQTSREFASDSAGAPVLNRAIAIARETGAGVVVWGSLYRQRDSVLFQPQITTVSSGRRLAALDPIVVNQLDVIGGAERVRSAVAGALASVLDKRIASISAPTNRPPNFEAYREYMFGLDAFVQHSYERALPHFEAAARLDTMFSLPLIWTVFAHINTGRSASVDSVVHILASRRARLAPLDRYSLEYFEARQRSDRSAMRVTAIAAANLSPASEWNHIASNLALGENRVREALAYSRQVDPEHGWARGWLGHWQNLTLAHYLLGDYEEELIAARRALRLAPREQLLAAYETRALIGAGRWDEAKRSIKEWLGWAPTGNGPGYLLVTAAREARAHGYRREADELMRHAVAWFESAAADRFIAAQDDTARARFNTRFAHAAALYGLEHWDESRTVLANIQAEDTSVIGMARSPQTIWALAYVGLLAARRGDRPGAEHAIAVLEAREEAPYYTAAIAALLGERERAVEYLKEMFNGRGSVTYTMFLHRDIDWELLRNYRPFQEVMRPKN